MSGKLGGERQAASGHVNDFGSRQRAGRVRPTGSVTPEHPPTVHALFAATRSARSRHAGDRSATTAALPAGDGGIHRSSVWRRIPADRASAAAGLSLPRSREAGSDGAVALAVGPAVVCHISTDQCGIQHPAGRGAQRGLARGVRDGNDRLRRSPRRGPGLPITSSPANHAEAHIGTAPTSPESSKSLSLQTSQRSCPLCLAVRTGRRRTAGTSIGCAGLGRPNANPCHAPNGSQTVRTVAPRLPRSRPSQIASRQPTTCQCGRSQRRC